MSSPLAYDPARRSSPALLRRPLAPADAHGFLARSRNPLRHTRPIPPSPSISKLFATIPNSPPVYSPPSPLALLDSALVSNSQAVADHYNARPNTSKFARTESPIFGLRKFNNWIKSYLIYKFASIQSFNLSSISSGLRVLELGCGKGGDLAKWHKAGVKDLFGFDLAQVSIQQAQTRYQDGFLDKFHAKFITLDCFTESIQSCLTQDELNLHFDAVSLQFCMHYAFENEAKVRMLLQNVSSYLKVGGRFIGTIPSPDHLLARFREIHGTSRLNPNDPDQELSFGNSVYEIKFSISDQDLSPVSNDRSDDHDQKIFGLKYSFYLKDAVDHVPEYIVKWEPFVKLANEYGLRLLYQQNFHDIFELEKNHYLSLESIHKNHHHYPRGKNKRSIGPVEQQQHQHQHLLRRMNVIDGSGHVLMNQDQWEACGLYMGFAFEKGD